MRSRAVAAFLVVAVGGLLATVVAGARDGRDLAFSLGVNPNVLAAELGPGDEACQVPVPVATAFEGIRMLVGTYHRPGPPLAVTVEDADGSRVIARGRLAGDYPDFTYQTFVLDRPVEAGGRVAVCVRNGGERRLALYGGPELARRGSTVEVDGRDQNTDLTLVFTTGERRSMLAQLPDVFARAALFHPAWIGAWTYWLLAALLVLAVPALLAAALGRAFAGDEPPRDG